MKVTVIGHSCLRLETRAGVILVDPWLFGSCYWRSWWHFPPSTPPDEKMLRPDFIYLTHHHFDHFHFPSLRKIDRSAQVLIPKFGVDKMAAEVTGLGFDAPREIPHAKTIDLGNGVRVASFQYGFDDTAFVVADGANVVVDLNDAKTRGMALRQIRKRFGRPTIACKSYSFAQSYPVLYKADDPADLELITRDTYVDDFHEVMSVLEPDFAVPFGSMVGFLHPESRSVNDHLVTPAEVVDGVEARGGLKFTKVVPMAPGDQWSTEAGFERSEFDWYANRESHLEDLATASQPKIQAQIDDEAGRAVQWAAFEQHFGTFVNQVPSFLGRRMVPYRIVFSIPSDTEAPYWSVSFADGKVARFARQPEDRAGVIYISEAVLADAIRDRITHMIHGSMRIRTELAAGGVKSDLAFWGLLMIWELGYLPVRRHVLRPRTWMAVLRRWREMGDQVPSLFRRDPVGHMAERFGAERT